MPAIKGAGWDDMYQIRQVASYWQKSKVVEQVEDRMAICNSLKEHLIQAQSTQLHITDAIVEKAVI